MGSRIVDAADRADAVQDRLAVFRDRLVQDSWWCDRLATLGDRDDFVRAACGVAAMMGLALDEGELQRALQSPTVGSEPMTKVALKSGRWPGSPWLPTGVRLLDGQWMIDWAHFGTASLAEPFFEQSIRVARNRPLNRLLRHHTLLPMPSDATTPPCRAPDGLIFHMSRCGSTLVSRMLAALPQHRVISEPPPLDSVVQLARSWRAVSVDDQARLLKDMVGALGNGLEDGDGRYFLKLDSWHALALPLFRHAFPHTPWIFLHRDPIEVIVSHMHMRGLQMVPGSMGDLFDIADGHMLAAEDYSARVLAKIIDAVIEHSALGGGLIVDYRTLPSAMHSQILPHFGIRPTAAERAAMDEIGMRDAKSPQEMFVADAGRKRDAATPAVHAAVRRHLAGFHRRLRQRPSGVNAVGGGDS